MGARSKQSETHPAHGDDEGIVVAVDLTDEHSGWTVEAKFRTYHSAPLLSRLTIEPTEEDLVPVSGVTARLLRELRLSDLYAALGNMPEMALMLAGIDKRDDYRDTRRPGRKGRPDLTYAVWAARYVEKCTEGSRRPIADLAADYGESERAVRDLVNRARERSLLAGGRKGRVGGTLTDRAIELLRAKEEQG